MAATFYIGDAIEVMNTLPEKSVDLILTSPPFLALRSYLPSDHPDKSLEGGSQGTPGEYIDWLLDVVETCARVLAPHGSLCFELGDTYSGSTLGFTTDDASGGYNTPGRQRQAQDPRADKSGTGWPLAKSLSLIPETFRFAMVYGRNPHTGRQTEPWRLRNVIRWVRPNPPVGALGDKFRPATSELMVFCKAKDRFFDLDAVREPSPYAGMKASTISGMRTDQTGDSVKQQHDDRIRYEAPATAPPLDWWNIPPGGYSGTTLWTERKPVNPRESLGDIRRTTSADCPMHAGPLDQSAKALRDELLSRRERSNPGNGDRPASSPSLGSVSTDQPTEPTLGCESWDSPDPSSEPAATRRSKASNKRVLAPATSSSDTASDKTPDRTGGTQAEPLSGEPHPDIQESRTSGVCLDGCSPGSCDHSFDRSSEGFDEACTCSYWTPEAKSTSHYAVWPPELLVKPIKAMCPEKVCRRCGEPSRRITDVSYSHDASHLNGVFPGDVERQKRSAERGVFVSSAIMPHGRATKNVETLGFSDCGHNDWRPGLVLDPFAGTGTTLAVATGHGRDAIGIDLDERNYELALDRVGPLILERGTEPARRINS